MGHVKRNIGRYTRFLVGVSSLLRSSIGQGGGSRRRLGCAWNQQRHKMVCSSSTHLNMPSRPVQPLNLSLISYLSSPPNGTSQEANRATPLHFGVMYHGHYDRVFGAHCSDFFAVKDNHKTSVLEPLRKMSRVSVYFHTYRSGCVLKDEALVSFLKPMKHEFSADILPRIVDSYLRVILMVTGIPASKRGSDYPDFLIIGRFDVQYPWPLTGIGIEYHKTNIAWRDKKEEWQHLFKSNDVFIACPTAHAAPLAQSLDKSAAHSPSHDGNLFYKYFSKKVGATNIRFIDSAFRTSTIDELYVLAHVGDLGGPKVFYVIDRSCFKKKHDAAVARNASGGRKCWAEFLT